MQDLAGLRPAGWRTGLHELSLRHSGARRRRRPRDLQRRRPDLPRRSRPCSSTSTWAARLPRDSPTDTSVMLIDCARMEPRLEPGRGPARRTRHADPEPASTPERWGALAPGWNAAIRSTSPDESGVLHLHDPAPAAWQPFPEQYSLSARIRSPSSGSSWSGRPTPRAIASSRARDRARGSPRRWRVTAGRGRPGAARPRQWTRRCAGSPGTSASTRCSTVASAGRRRRAPSSKLPSMSLRSIWPPARRGPRPRRMPSSPRISWSGCPSRTSRGSSTSCSRTRGGSSSPSWTPAVRGGCRPAPCAGAG